MKRGVASTRSMPNEASSSRAVERDVGRVAVVEQRGVCEAGCVEQTVQLVAAVGSVANRIGVTFAAAVEAPRRYPHASDGGSP